MKNRFAKTMLLATVILMDILGGAETDLFVPSFPELQHHFNLTPFWVEGLLSVNFTGYCLSLFFVGVFADRYGRKPILLFGLGVFIVGSFLCWGAPSYSSLVIGRFLQGIGVAAPTTLCFLIIADTYPLKQQQSLMGILTGLMNLSVGAAPVVGSYVALYFHWQGNFMLLLSLGIVTFLLTALFIPTYPLPVSKESLSLRGYLPIFRFPLILLVMTSLTCVPYWIVVGMAPILYMEDLGVSLAHFGYYQGIWASVFAIGSLFSGFLTARYNQKNLLILSIALCMIGLIFIGVITILDTPNPLLITLAFVPFSLGEVLPSVILYPLCLNYMPQAKGRVAAVIQGVRLIFMTLGIEIAGYYYAGSFRNIGIVLIVSGILIVISLQLVVKNWKYVQGTSEQ